MKRYSAEDIYGYLCADAHEKEGYCKFTDHQAEIDAYRGALGYSVPGDHDGRLANGELPRNGIAEALQAEISKRDELLAECLKVLSIPTYGNPAYELIPRIRKLIAQKDGTQ